MLSGARVIMPPIIGLAEAIDGDTLRIHGQRVRLWGIDALEHDQTCDDPSTTTTQTKWLGGIEATAFLAKLVDNKTVRCEPRGNDQYRRVDSIGQRNTS
jgi:endonuclease YncB( thermonuclease family)